MSTDGLNLFIFVGSIFLMTVYLFSAVFAIVALIHDKSRKQPDASYKQLHRQQNKPDN